MKYYFTPIFIGEETEARRGEVTCPKPHFRKRGELADLGGFVRESVFVLGYACEMNVCA